jgi:hypothetical protein
MILSTVIKGRRRQIKTGTLVSIIIQFHSVMTERKLELDHDLDDNQMKGIDFIYYHSYTQKTLFSSEHGVSTTGQCPSKTFAFRFADAV